MRSDFSTAAMLVLLGASSAVGDITTTPADRKKADPREASPPLPRAAPVEAKVARGGSVEIPLRAAGTAAPIKLIVRAQPRFGKLFEVQMNGRNSGVVVYRHNGDTTRARDQFLYAVQTDQGVSVAAEVNITIVVEPPRLGVVAELDFGSARVGDAMEKEMTIENRGDVPARGALSADAPWSVSGEANYELAAGEKKQVTVVFAPSSEEEFRGVLRYGAEVVEKTALHGVATAPLRVSPRLALTAKGFARTGAFTIENRTHEAQTVLLRSAARLHTVDRVALPADEKTSVNVETRTNSPEGFEDEVLVELGSFATRVAVVAPSAPALFRTTPDALHFPAAALQASASLPLRVQNIGGATAWISAEIAAPFRIVQPDFTVPAGDEVELQIALDTGRAGNFNTELTVKTVAGNLVVPVTAEVLDPDAASRPLTLALASEPAPAQASPPVTPGAPVQPQLVPARQISDLRVTRAGQHDAEIAWSGPDKTEFKIEERILSFDQKHHLQMDWIPATDTVVKMNEAGKPTAHFTNLTAGRKYVVRIVLLGANGVTVEQSLPVEIATAAETKRAAALYNLLWIALASVFGLMFRRWWTGHVRRKK